MGFLKRAFCLRDAFIVCSFCLCVFPVLGNVVPSNPKVVRGDYSSSLRSSKKSKSKYVTTEKELSYQTEHLKRLIGSYRGDIKRLTREIKILSLFQKRAQDNLKKTLAELKQIGTLGNKLSPKKSLKNNPSRPKE